jgi:hypothetical protein
VEQVNRITAHAGRRTSYLLRNILSTKSCWKSNRSLLDPVTRSTSAVKLMGWGAPLCMVARSTFDMPLAQLLKQIASGSYDDHGVAGNSVYSPALFRRLRNGMNSGRSR